MGVPHALGCPRFSIEEPARVLWLAEEDNARIIAFRLGLMLKARGINAGDEPEALFFRVRPGWNLETPEGQAGILNEIEATKAEVLVIDPTRTSFPSIDGGPKDAAPGRAFLLKIMGETSAKVILSPHHDTKPPVKGGDSRSRAERASGGVTFSMGDCMVNFERVSDRETNVYPTNYKLSADPKPFLVTWESRFDERGGFSEYLRAKAATLTGDEEVERLVKLLEATPWQTKRDIEEATGTGKGGWISKAITRGVSLGQLVEVTGEQAARRGRARTAKLYAPAGSDGVLAPPLL
jgi:hypothetical protein